MEISFPSLKTKKWGGCIIFKGSNNSEQCYLLTARHNITQSEELNNSILETLSIANLNIQIFGENKKSWKIEALSNDSFLLQTK